MKKEHARRATSTQTEHIHRPPTFFARLMMNTAGHVKERLGRARTHSIDPYLRRVDRVVTATTTTTRTIADGQADDGLDDDNSPHYNKRRHVKQSNTNTSWRNCPRMTIIGIHSRLPKYRRGSSFSNLVPII